MNLLTNIKLFSKGYSFDDIKALGEIEGMTDELALQCADKELKVDDITKLAALNSAPGVTPENTDNGADAANGGENKEKESEPEPDYKALYEAEKLKVENLQKMNVNAPAGKSAEIKTDFDKLCDLMNANKN